MACVQASAFFAVVEKGGPCPLFQNKLNLCKTMKRMRPRLWTLLPLLAKMASSQMAQGVYPSAFPVCLGETEYIRINMSVDDRGEPLVSGRTVDRLPEDIRVFGRRSETPPVRPLKNELMVLNTTALPKKDPSYTQRQGNVLMLNQHSKKKTRLSPNEKGGTILFKFDRPIYRFESISFVAVDPEKKPYITAKNVHRRRLDSFSVNTRGGHRVVTVFPEDWLSVQTVRVALQGRAAVSKIAVTVCRGGK